MAQSDAVRDEILSRIADDRLRGIRVDDIGPVVTDGNGRAMYAVEADIEDYISRGNTLLAPCPQRGVRLAVNYPRVIGTLQVCYLARPAVASRPVTQRRKNVPEIHKLVSSRS
jgi:hypothetical protein